ncbi:hypothetical protein HID58_014688 [Brassica napus]|uniref:Secreted protein n=1 Tax=Brassica napus TaxID=3708 RepID=A0ABQ8DHZ8_BRANA|nr:hypothetical protein HID58_095008 [Brassica napus]KAH0928961.1 hypothetical protein HID58_014688 [Brassica napus]
MGQPLSSSLLLCSYAFFQTSVLCWPVCCLVSHVSPSHRRDRISAIHKHCCVWIFSSRHRHISTIRLWAHGVKLKPRGLNRA